MGAAGITGIVCLVHYGISPVLITALRYTLTDVLYVKIVINQ